MGPFFQSIISFFCDFFKRKIETSIYENKKQLKQRGLSCLEEVFLGYRGTTFRRVVPKVSPRYCCDPALFLDLYAGVCGADELATEQSACLRGGDLYPPLMHPLTCLHGSEVIFHLQYQKLLEQVPAAAEDGDLEFPRQGYFTPHPSADETPEKAQEVHHAVFEVGLIETDSHLPF
jgi:hypothetical protein